MVAKQGPDWASSRKQESSWEDMISHKSCLIDPKPDEMQEISIENKVNHDSEWLLTPKFLKKVSAIKG
jgi:hypothetical protein